MIALFFEVTPRIGEDHRYLEIAAALKPELETSGGCLFLERYRSLARPRTLLSHQVWADEASLARWRSNGRHHDAQSAGRAAVFDDYRIRVGAVIATAGEGGRLTEAPPGNAAYNDPARVPERYMTVMRSREAPCAGDGEAYASVYNPSEHALVGTVADRAAGIAAIRQARGDARVHTALLCLVSRDYGMHERSEAPQYFPPRA